MAFSETILKRRQWHSLESAAQFLSMGIGETVSVDQLVELAKSGDIPIFVDLSMPAWPLIEAKGAPKAHLSFTVHEHPIPSSPLPGMTVNADDTDCVLMGKYELKTPPSFSPLSEWYVKDPKSGEPFIPGHQYKSLPSGKSFPERPEKPAPESWLFRRKDLEEISSNLLENCSGGEPGVDEVKVAEVLGLMAETFASQSQKYGGTEKPNVSQIAQAMCECADHADGMGKRKLESYISDGLKNWKRWKDCR